MNVIERQFNGLAPAYEHNRLAPWYQAHAELILRHCGPLPHGMVLDVGCATGYLLRRFLARNPGASGVGIDIAAAMVAEAGRRAHRDGLQRLDFQRGDWETLDIGPLEGRFDLVFCANALHYFAAPAEAAARFHRVLADGGRLYLLERNKANSALTRLWGWLHRHWIRDNVEFYSLDELRRCLTGAGFEPVSVAHTVTRLLWKNKLYTSIALLECSKGHT